MATLLVTDVKLQNFYSSFAYTGKIMNDPNDPFLMTVHSAALHQSTVRDW